MSVTHRTACRAACGLYMDSQKAKTEIYFRHCCYDSGPNSSIIIIIIITIFGGNSIFTVSHVWCLKIVLLFSILVVAQLNLEDPSVEVVSVCV